MTLQGDLRTSYASAYYPQRMTSRSGGAAQRQHQRAAAGRRPAPGTPQSCWCMWQAAPSPPWASQDAARAATCSTPSPTARRGRASGSGRCRDRRRRGAARRRRLDEQLGRRPEPVVDLLPRRRLERDHELHLAGADLGDRALGGVGEPGGRAAAAPSGTGPAGARPTRPRRGARRRRTRRSARPARSPAWTPRRSPGRSAGPPRCRCRRPRRCRRAARSRRAGAGAAPAPPGRRGSRSRTGPCRPRCARRRPRPSAARRSRCPRSTAGRRRGDSPDVWANHASAPDRRAGPRWWCRRPPRPRRCAGRTSRAGGSRPSRSTPGPATRPRPTGWRATGGAVALHPLLPSPASVAHLAGLERDAAQLVVDGVGDHHVVPDLGGDVGRQQAQPVGLVEGRLRGGPVGPALGARPDPVYDGLASPASSTTWWWPASATRTRRRAARPPWPGSAGRRARRSAGRTASRPAAGCPAPRCSSRSSSSSASIAWAWPSPAYCATTYPSGSTSTRVGQARAV